MFTITKEELEKLGMEKDWKNVPYFRRKLHDLYELSYVPMTNNWFIENMYDKDAYDEIYPQSIDDIKTLIRLLTPNN